MRDLGVLSPHPLPMSPFLHQVFLVRMGRYTANYLRARARRNEGDAMNAFTVAMLLGFLQEPAVASESSEETLIDIDVREADVQDVLRLLAEVGGFNLAVDPGVSCKATLKLKQVPWPQVLELVLRTCGLDQEIPGREGARRTPRDQVRAARLRKGARPRAYSDEVPVASGIGGVRRAHEHADRY